MLAQKVVKQRESKMSTDERPSYLIAENLLDAAGSKLLGRATLDDTERLQPAYDLTEFVGRGYRINLCEKITSPDAAKDLVVTVDVGGEKQYFEVSYIVKGFPLVEGTFAPGIYEMIEYQYYALDDVAALSENAEGDPNLSTGDYKLVCRADAVEFIELPGGELLCTIERHPFSFFDVFCPLCRERIMSYEKSQNKFDLNRCEIVETPCPHFVGNSVRMEGFGYEPGQLEEHGLNHKFVGGELFFEAAPGEWHKALIYNPPGDRTNCYWSDVDSQYKDDFFFVENR